jgi:hypothetical protein
MVLLTLADADVEADADIMKQSRAIVLGRWLDPESNIHIPVGVAHDIDATEPEGCPMYFADALVAVDRPDR